MYPTGPQRIDHRVLGASGVAVAGAADTNENILASIPIPGELMGLNGILMLETLWSYTNSVNNKTLRARLGGIGGTAFLAFVATTSATFRDRRIIMNRNSQAVQIGCDAASSFWGISTAAVQLGAINTAVDTTLVLTGQKATAGETLQLEYFNCELYRPDFLTRLYN